MLYKSILIIQYIINFMLVGLCSIFKAERKYNQKDILRETGSIDVLPYIRHVGQPLYMLISSLSKDNPALCNVVSAYSACSAITLDQTKELWLRLKQKPINSVINLKKARHLNGV